LCIFRAPWTELELDDIQYGFLLDGYDLIIKNRSLDGEHGYWERENMYDPNLDDDFSSQFQQAESRSTYSPTPRNDFTSRFEQAEMNRMILDNPLRLDTKRAGKRGILIVGLCLFSLLALLFLPLMAIEEVEYSWSYDGMDEESSKWKVIDFFGDEYLFGEEFMSDEEWRYVDSINAGRWQGIWGSIVAILLGIALIVFGFLKPISDDARKAFSFVRGMLAIFLLVPAVLMMIIGSKWVGWAVSNAISTDSNGMIPLSPLLTAMIGIAVFILSILILRHEKDIMRAMNKRQKTEISGDRSLFEEKSNNISRLMLIAALLVLVTMHLLPIFIFSEDYDGESSTQLVSLQQLDGFPIGGDLGDAVDSFSTFHLVGWFTFSIVLFVIFAQFFYSTNWSPLGGHILLVCGNAVIITIIIQLIFKSIGIVKTFSKNSDIGDEGTIFFGFNYLPLLAIFGLIVATILFAVISIKGLVNFVQGPEMPTVPKEGSIFDDPDLMIPPPRQTSYAPPPTYRPPSYP
jgi:hypothetical protein